MLEDKPFEPREETIETAIPQLSQAAKQSALQFILEFGKNLQRERLLYHFPQSSSPNPDDQNVLAALGHYQNLDGGFGHGLEADLRTKKSTVIATTVGLQILESVDALESESADRALQYLIGHFEDGAWQPIHDEANDLPHAPWWKFEAPTPGFKPNPSAEVIKYLLERNAMSTETEDLVETAINYVFDTPLEMHELLCYVRLYESKALNHDQRIALLPYMLSNGFRLVNSEPRDWEEYCLTPLSVTTNPTSIFAEFFSDVILANFQFLIDTQKGDGSWSPNWSWAGEFPATWRVVETEITAEITLQNLLKFHRFGGLMEG
jgi:hypothetical protein